MQSAALHGSLGESDVALFCAVAKRRAAREPALSVGPFSSRRPTASAINVIWSQEGPRDSLHKRLRGGRHCRRSGGDGTGGITVLMTKFTLEKMWSLAALAGMKIKGCYWLFVGCFDSSCTDCLFWWLYKRKPQERVSEEGLLFVKFVPDCVTFLFFFLSVFF